MNKNWNRWLFASISKHFVDAMAAANVTLHIEGQDRTDPTLEDNYVELRVTGPVYQKQSRSTYKAEVQVNCLVNVMIDQQDNHRIFRICGVVEKAFDDCISAFKYGDTEDDDPSVSIGALQLIQNAGNDIETSHFGQVAADVRVLQSTVEGHYRIYLDN